MMVRDCDSSSTRTAIQLPIPDRLDHVRRLNVLTAWEQPRHQCAAIVRMMCILEGEGRKRIWPPMENNR